MSERRRRDPSPKGNIGRIRKRSITGCRNCRRKKKKCDETKPTCGNCVKSVEQCNWGRPLSFRPENAFTVDYSPCPEAYKSRQAKTLNAARDGSTASLTTEIHSDMGRRFQEANLGCSPSSCANQLDNTPRSELSSNEPGLVDSTRVATGIREEHCSPQMQISLGSAQLFTEVMDDDENTQFGLLSSNTEDLHSAEPQFFHSSPESLTSDGIFLPGSTYQKLHKTLRNTMFNTFVSTSSPKSADLDGDGTSTALAPTIANSRTTNSTDADRNLADPPELTPYQEYILWNNWVVEISAWLDNFDHHRHFRHTLPSMTKTCEHLRYSILALSARQLEKKDGTFPPSLSLSLYQEAIHQLVPSLNVKDVTIVASCVILAVLEMFSCSPKAWRRHLDGCAGLIQAMDIRGDSGGVEQSLFWCFARMDLCGGLISSEPTIIPINRWMSNTPSEVGSIANDYFEDYACRSSYLAARVLDLFYGPESFPDRNTLRKKNSAEQKYYNDLWTELFDSIEDWYTYRPSEMQALISIDRNDGGSSVDEGSRSPFPTLLFCNGAAISGNQLYHVAALLMLQNKPYSIKRKTRSMLWHALRICAISMSNKHHGCWTNCIQPLWLAGQLMSHSSEHEAIIKIYEQIERDTGFAAIWRADDLKEYWGDIGVN